VAFFADYQLERDLNSAAVRRTLRVRGRAWVLKPVYFQVIWSALTFRMCYDEAAMSGSIAPKRHFLHQGVTPQMALLQGFPIQFP